MCAEQSCLAWCMSVGSMCNAPCCISCQIRWTVMVHAVAGHRFISHVPVASVEHVLFMLTGLVWHCHPTLTQCQRPSSLLRVCIHQVSRCRMSPYEFQCLYLCVPTAYILHVTSCTQAWTLMYLASTSMHMSCRHRNHSSRQGNTVWLYMALCIHNDMCGPHQRCEWLKCVQYGLLRHEATCHTESRLLPRVWIPHTTFALSPRCTLLDQPAQQLACSLTCPSRCSNNCIQSQCPDPSRAGCCSSFVCLHS